MTYYDRRPVFTPALTERNPDFESINTEFISGTGSEVSFERSKNPGNIWI